MFIIVTNHNSPINVLWKFLIKHIYYKEVMTHSYLWVQIFRVGHELPNEQKDLQSGKKRQLLF